MQLKAPKPPRHVLASCALCLSAGIALFALAGRALHLTPLAAWMSNTVAMKDTTAWLILEHTAAGFLLCRPTRREFCVPICLVAFTTIMLALGLTHEILNMENLATFDPKASFFPSIITVAAGVLLAFKGIASYFDISGRVANFFSALVVLIGVSAVSGYLLKIPTLYFFIPGYTTAMAVNTAIAFILLGSVIVPHAK